VNDEKLRAAMTQELYVTDEVYKRVAEGTPFREAYVTVKSEFFKHKESEQKAS